MPSRTYATAVAALMVLLTASAAQADQQIDPAGYRELAPEALLPAILAELRHTLPDVYSVREMRLCPASHIKLKDGQPNDWSVRLEFNARNETGGYAGIRRDVAVFKNRHIAGSVGTAPQLGRTGLNGVFSKMVDKQMAPCTAIPDAAIQQALAAAK